MQILQHPIGLRLVCRCPMTFESQTLFEIRKESRFDLHSSWNTNARNSLLIYFRLRWLCCNVLQKHFLRPYRSIIVRQYLNPHQPGEWNVISNCMVWKHFVRLRNRLSFLLTCLVTSDFWRVMQSLVNKRMGSLATSGCFCPNAMIRKIALLAKYFQTNSSRNMYMVWIAAVHRLTNYNTFNKCSFLADKVIEVLVLSSSESTIWFYHTYNLQ